MSTLTAQLSAVVAMYRDQAVAAAQSEAEHKRVRARRFLTAMHDGEAKSAAMADSIAEADDQVADLYSKRLVSAAVADATKQKVLSLRTEIEYERSLMADRRAEDAFHARDRNAP